MASTRYYRNFENFADSLIHDSNEGRQIFKFSQGIKKLEHVYREDMSIHLNNIGFVDNFNISIADYYCYCVSNKLVNEAYQYYKADVCLKIDLINFCNRIIYYFKINHLIDVGVILGDVIYTENGKIDITNTTPDYRDLERIDYHFVKDNQYAQVPETRLLIIPYSEGDAKKYNEMINTKETLNITLPSWVNSKTSKIVDLYT
ncbi:MAG: hypothetical protein KBD37_01090 [Burkholderiales bacterium]|nr:hypothetical protein [Burkholderiales bacterium]